MTRIIKLTVMLLLMATHCNISAANKTDSIFKIAGDHGQLLTRLQLPQASGKVPVVIMCHGFMGSMKGALFDSTADSLLAKGIGVVRFDFNGHGRSEGRFEDMTVPNEIEDAKKIIEWAERQPFTESVSLVGHSQGGVVAAMTAGQLGYPRIKSLVLLAPAAVLRDDALRGLLFGKMYSADKVPESVEVFDGKRLGRNYVLTAQVLPIYETAANYTGPALILHGTSDRVVPYTYGERFAREMPTGHIETITGENHGFTKTTARTVGKTAHWLNNILAK